MHGVEVTNVASIGTSVCQSFATYGYWHPCFFFIFNLFDNNNLIPKLLCSYAYSLHISCTHVYNKSNKSQCQPELLIQGRVGM